MKIGQFIPLGIYDNVKIGYGTVDRKNLKTIYLTLNSWILPNFDDDYDTSILKSRKKIKDIIRNLDDGYFKEESIVDLDLRTKGMKLEKKSFMNLEITLYVKKDFNLKDKIIKNLIKNIIQNIIDNGLTNKNLYNFHVTKK
jgi:hypothetical protein